MNLRNFLSYSLRIVNKNRAYTAINLLGLSLGLAVFTLIILFVRYEFGYDRYHANLDRIYRIIRDGDGDYLGTTKSVIAAAPIAGVLKESVKEADHITRIAAPTDVLVQTEGHSFFESQLYAADPDFFHIFSLDVIAGQNKDLLADPTNVVISESIAVKWYGSVANAIGKTITAEKYRNFGDYVVQAVVRDMPFQSHFVAKIILPFEAYVKATQPSDLEGFDNNNYWIYFTLQPGRHVSTAEKAINLAMKDRLTNYDKPPVIFFQPLADIHLGERMSFDLTVVGNRDSLYIFLCIAMLVLAIACINYINMATARAANRAKEIGVRKVNGALRIDLIVQFLSEAFLSVISAAVIAVGAVALLLPAYNEFLTKEMSVDFLLQPTSIAFALFLIVTVAMIAGAYPAFLFSSFKPIQTLKGTFRQSHNSALRNALVVFQFVVSGTLVFGMLVVWKQLQYVKNKDLGFNREHVVIIPLRDQKLRDKHAGIRELLLRNPSIKNVSASMGPPTGIRSQMSRNWPGKNGEQNISVYHNQVDTNFLSVYQMKLVAGSNLTATSPKIDAVVNEALVHELGYTNEEIVGMLFARQWDSTRIVGVVGDFHFQDFRLKIEPVDFKRFNWGSPSFLSVKLNEANAQSTLDFVRKTLAGISEKYPFEYTFYDDFYGRTFASETKISNLMTVFAAVAILIAALGLYGLILHMVNQRMKEIGIRKTLGAGSLSIIRLLSGKFGVLILIGYAISCGAGYYGVQRWLDGFVYRVSPTVLDFVLTFMTIAIIAAVAVYSRIAVALRINPASVLKQE